MMRQWTRRLPQKLEIELIHSISKPFRSIWVEIQLIIVDNLNETDVYPI